MNRLKKAIADFGVVGIIKRSLNPVYRRFILLKSINSSNDVPLSKDLTVLEVSAASIKSYHEKQPELVNERRYSIFMNRLSNTQIQGYFVENKIGDVVAWAFMRTDLAEDPFMQTFQLKQNESFFFDLFTAPIARRLGIQRHLFQRLKKDCNASVVYTLVDWTNRKSLHLMKKLNFKAVKYYSTRIIKNRKLTKERIIHD